MNQRISDEIVKYIIAEGSIDQDRPWCEKSLAIDLRDARNELEKEYKRRRGDMDHNKILNDEVCTLAKRLGKKDREIERLRKALRDILRYADPIENGSHAFIQWKGTDVCADIHCAKCGAHGHFDGDFMYFVQCQCGAVYEVGYNVSLTEIDPGDERGSRAVLPDYDEDKVVDDK